MTTEELVAAVLAFVASDRRWTVLCGDSIALMPTLPEKTFDHALTDPPYDDVTHVGAVTVSLKKAVLSKEEKGVSFSHLLSPGELAVQLVRVSKRWAVAFCACEQLGEYQHGNKKTYIRGGIWDRIRPTPQITGDRPGQAVDAIAIMHRAGKKRWNNGGCAGIWRHLPVTGADRPDHPTPKPLGLCLELIQDFTDPNDLIFDPFSGSGQMGHAALMLNRRYLGIDIDPVFAELSRENCRAAEGSRKLAHRQSRQIGLFDMINESENK